MSRTAGKWCFLTQNWLQVCWEETFDEFGELAFYHLNASSPNPLALNSSRDFGATPASKVSYGTLQTFLTLRCNRWLLRAPEHSHPREQIRRLMAAVSELSTLARKCRAFLDTFIDGQVSYLSSLLPVKPKQALPRPSLWQRTIMRATCFLLNFLVAMVRTKKRENEF